MFTPPGGSTFLCEMTSWPPSWKCEVKSKIRLLQSMHIYLKNCPAKFHPDPIWNDEALGFYRAMHFSAKRGLAIACRLSVCRSVGPSVCNVGGSGPHRWEILETNCTDNQPNTFALRSPKPIHLRGEHGEIFGRLEVGWEKSGVLEHKSGNISETCNDRGKVTKGSL